MRAQKYMCDSYLSFPSLGRVKSIKHKAHWHICLSRPPEAISHTGTVKQTQMLQTWLQLQRMPHFQILLLYLRHEGLVVLPPSTRFHWLSLSGWAVYDNDSHDCQLKFTYLAAAARRFLALAAPGSTDSDLAASSSLLEAIEMFFRLPITCIWSSLDCKLKKKSNHNY